MNTIQARPRLKFHSRPKKQRISNYVMSFLLILGWTLMPLILATTYISIQTDLAMGFAAVLIAFSVGICLAIATRQFLKMSTAEGYELLIESDVIFLFGVDKKDNRRLCRELSLDVVNEADYYPTSDTSTIVLHSEEKADLEIPLWAFGKHAEEEVVQYLRSRIKVVDIPSAIVI